MTADELAQKRRIDAILSTTNLVADGSKSESLALLIAAIVSLCQEAKDPADTLKLAMQALEMSRSIVLASEPEGN